MVVADAAMQVLRRAVAGDAVAGDAEARELLDVEVQQRPRPRPLVAAVCLPLPARPPREAVPAEHLPDRRAGTPDEAGEPRRAQVRLAARAQDRLLLRRAQPPRLPMWTRRTISKRGERAATVEPTVPPTMRGRRRDTEADRRLPERHPCLDREHQFATPGQSELRVSVQIHHGPPSGGVSWRTRTASKEGRMYLSAVHNLCGQLS